MKEGEYETKDLERLRWLRDNTHEEIMASLYELDRMVDPTRGERINTQFTLENGNTYTQDRIQYFCCRAIEETHEIIYRTLKKYKIEIPLDVDRDTGQSSDDW